MGLSGALRQLVRLLDLTGESHSRQTLGVDKHADLAAVKRAYRALF